MAQCILAASFLTTMLFAQSATTSLTVRVVDPQGAAVPDATVFVNNASKSVERQYKTNENGLRPIEPLPPSSYTIRVEKSGFAPAVFEDVSLHVASSKVLPVHLIVGESKVRVEVHTDPPLIADSAAVSTVVDQHMMDNQPNNGRTGLNLIELTPGIAITTSSLTTQGQFSSNGQRTGSNNYMIDGVSANFASVASTFLYETAGGGVPSLSASGTWTSLASLDAIRELSVQTSTYGPEFGRQPGAQISMVTRSGTNAFHGGVFNYLRNSVFDANNWFANRSGLDKPAVKQNDFGGMLGGPVRFPGFRNDPARTFFFVSYEGVRVRQPVVTEQLEVPSTEARNNATGVIRDILNAFPLPTSNDVAGSSVASYVGSFSNPQSVNATSLRIDHVFSPNLTVFGRYNYAPSEDQGRARFCAASCVALLKYRTQTLTTGATFRISSTMFNDLRLNWSEAKVKQSYFLDNFGGAIAPPASSLYPSFTTRDQGYIYIEANTSGSNTLSDGLFSDNRQRQWNLVDTVSMTRGSHTIKFGIDYRHLGSRTNSGTYKRQWRPDSMTRLVNNTASGATIFAPAVVLHPLYSNLSAFAQDTWRLSRRLTLTYGLRYEVNPAPSEENGELPFTVVNINDPANLALAPQGTKLYETTYNNFAPRVGVTYEVLPEKRMVVRGGFGVFYDLGYTYSGTAFSTEIFPFVGRLDLTTSFTDPLFSPPPPPRTLGPPYARVFAYDSNMKSPYTLQYNLTVEHGVGKRDTVSVAYVGANGRRLGRVESLRNVAAFTRIDVVRDNGSSDYNALQIQYRHHLAHGLQVLGSYTLAKSLDTVSEESFQNFQTPSGQFSPLDDRGPSTFDVRHGFTAALSYAIPFPSTHSVPKAIFSNWALDGRVRAVSARPVNVTTGRDPFASLGYSSVVRPDLVPGQSLYLDDVNAPGGRRFNPAAFDAVTPVAAQRQGTFGRNVMRGFPASQVDLAIHRDFTLAEGWKLQFRADSYNLFNHANFNNPIGSTRDANFGRSTQMLASGLGGLSPLYQVGGPRSFQFALKVLF